ncbi:4Fe-4S binding protein [Chloroflexota bacterium]
MYGLGLIKGLGVTMRHFIDSYVYDRKPWEKRYNEEWLEKHQDPDGKGLFTIQYPEQRRQVPENFRFTPMLVYEDSADEPRCTACGICARVCPPQCIYIRRATDDKGRPRPRPDGFWIDTTVCMSCGSCAEYCPFDAIKMNQVHEAITTDRDRDLFLDMDRLLVPITYYAELHPTDYAAEESARKAKEDAKRQAAEDKAAAAASKKAEEAAAAEAAAASASPDDLERIEGIGPKISKVLNAAGVTTYLGLSKMKPDQITEILAKADPDLLKLAEPATWPNQSRLAAGGKWEALERYQEKLRAGREAK